MATNTGGSLYFEGGIDTQKLFDDVEKINTQIKGMADNTVSQGQRMDSAMNLFSQNMAGSLKESIQRQKQIIAVIESDIDRLQKKLAQPETFGRIRNDAVLDLNSAKKVLAEEQAILNEMQNKAKPVYDENAKTIANLTARIKELTEAQKNMVIGSAEFKKTSEDLKKANDELKTATKDAQPKEVPNPVLESIKKWAIGLASVTGALEFGKKVIESTEATAHSFEQVMNAASSATGYFFKTIASGDWSNFLSGMDKAVTGAIQYTNAMEEVRNMANQDKITSAELDKIIAELREKTYDRSRGNDKERLEAYDKMIKNYEQKFKGLEGEKYGGLIGTAQKRYDALIDKASSDTGGKTSVKEIDEFISKYRSLEEMIEKGNEYNKLKSIKYIAPQGGFNPTMGNLEEYEKAQEELKAMGEEGRLAGEKAANISKIIFPVRDALSKAKAELIGLQAQMEQGNAFIKRSRGSLVTRMEADAAEAAKKATEEKNKFLKDQNDYATEIGRQRIENQLKIDQQVLDTQKDGAEKQRKQADLDFKKSVFDLTKQYQDQLKKYNELNGGIDKKTGQKTAKYVSSLPEEDFKQYDLQIENARKLRDKKIHDIDEKEAENIKKIWNEVNDSIISGMEKEKAAANEKYDKLLKDAEGHSDLIQAIENARVEKLRQIDLKYALDKVKTEEDLEMKMNKIRITGFDRQFKLQQANYQTWRNARMQEFNLLKGSMNPEDQKKAGEIMDSVNQGDKDNSLSIQEKKLKISQEILQNTGQLIVSNAELLGLNEEQAKALSSAMQLGDAAAKAASGDIIGAATEAAGAIMSVLSTILTKSSEFEQTMERINHLIELQNYQFERQKALIDNLIGKSSIDATTVAIEKNKKDLEDLQEIMDKGVVLGGMRGMKEAVAVLPKGDIEKYRDAYEQILKYQQQGYDFKNKEIDGLKKIIDDYDTLIQRGKDLALANEQALTGTNFSELSDQMAEMFDTGKDSAVDFADTLESNLKRALINAFKQQFLMAQLDKLNKDLAIAMGDNNGLTDEEMKAYADGYKAIFDNAKKQWNEMKSTFPDVFSDNTMTNESLAGRVQQAITEDTATEFVGTWNRMSLDLRENVNTSKLAITHLVQIAANTLRTANNTEELSRLANMENSLRNLESSFNRIPSIRDLRS